MLITTLDKLGALLSFSSTWAYTQGKLAAWPIGIIACLVNGYLYCVKGIYADAILECFFIALSIQGWWQWNNDLKSQGELTIRHISMPECTTLLIIGAVMSGVFGFLLHRYTPSTVPYVDATTAIFSLLAQWMIGRKIIECWLVWFVVDSAYVWLYASKTIPYHSALMICYVGIAILGYIRWYKLMGRAETHSLMEASASA